MAEGRDLRGREFVFFLSKKRVSRLEEAWFTFRFAFAVNKMALLIFSSRKKKTVFLLKKRQCSPVFPSSPVNVYGEFGHLTAPVGRPPAPLTWTAA